MKGEKLPRISAEKILKRIEGEIGKQKSLHREEGDNDLLPRNPEEGIQANNSTSLPPEQRGPVSRLLWKYGTRYAALIKKVPVLSGMAEYVYWRLSGVSRTSPWIPTSPSPSPDFLAANLNYAGFIEGLKREGLKGKVKRTIFAVIGFFAWWQEQINQALYERTARQEGQLLREEARSTEQEARISLQEAELIKRETRLAEQEARISLQEAQLIKQEAQLAEQKAQLQELREIASRLSARAADRDKAMKDFEHTLSVLNKLEDAIYEELTAQRTEIARRGGCSAVE
jgi:hypothetical protein